MRKSLKTTGRQYPTVIKNLGLGWDHTCVLSPSGLPSPDLPVHFTVTSRDAHPWSSLKPACALFLQLKQDCSGAQAGIPIRLLLFPVLGFGHSKQNEHVPPHTAYKVNVSLNRKRPVCCNMFNNQFLAYLCLVPNILNCLLFQ